MYIKLYLFKLSGLLFFTIAAGIIFLGCDKDENTVVQPSDLLAIDSLVASDKDVLVWETVTITAYTKGENLNFLWSTNHGTMMAGDSSSVLYWGCPSCVGLNTVRCQVSNEYGMVSDTILINVSPD